MALIEANGIGKLFDRVERRRRATLARDLLRILSGRAPESRGETGSRFHALHDISFSVDRGEALGIIGHNGAGKTTLLRILAGEYPPDEGTLAIGGARGTLIDLTSGFSPELSGRENIYARGAYLGFSRGHLKRIESDIVAFAGIGEFIDSDVRNYSSGMMLRLGFAISVFLEPDILLVDEILAVGDFMFAAKCMRKMNELRERTAIVFVTHSTELAVQFCDRIMVIDRGTCRFLGAPAEAVRVYYEIETAKQAAEEGSLGAVAARPTVASMKDGSAAPQAEPSIATEAGSARREATSGIPHLVRSQMSDFTVVPERISEVRLCWENAGGVATEMPVSLAPLLARIGFTLHAPIRRLVIGIPLWSDKGELVTAFGTQGLMELTALPEGRHEVILDIPAFGPTSGVHHPVLAILDGTEYLFRQAMAPLAVQRPARGFEWGSASFSYQWRLDDERDRRSD